MILIALGLLLIPFLFGGSVTSEELKLSGQIPDRPEKPAALDLSIPSKESTVANVQPAPVPQSTPTSRIVFEQVPATSLVDGSQTPQETSAPVAESEPLPPVASSASLPLISKAEPLEPPTSVSLPPISKAETGTPTAASTPQTATVPSVAPLPSKEMKVAATPESWVVQVGSFSEQANAETLMKKIQTAGFPAYLTTAKTSKGKLIKVLVGPEILKSSADKMQVKLAQTLGVKGIVVKAAD